MTRATHIVAGEARTIEGRLSTSEWLVGDQPSAADLVVFPGIMLLLRAMEKREAGELRSRFLPMAVTYPAIARWINGWSSCRGTNARIRRTGATVRRAVDPRAANAPHGGPASGRSG